MRTPGEEMAVELRKAGFRVHVLRCPAKDPSEALKSPASARALYNLLSRVDQETAVKPVVKPDVDSLDLDTEEL